MAAVYMGSGAFIVGKKEEDSLLSQRPFFFHFISFIPPTALLLMLLMARSGLPSLCKLGLLFFQTGSDMELKGSISERERKCVDDGSELSKRWLCT